MMRLLQLRQCEVIGLSLITACTLSLLCFGFSSFPLQAQQPPPPLPGSDPTQQEGITELNRGPVHEGFAHPFQMKNGEGMLIDRQSPAPIQEVPSRQVPQSQDYQWVSGYWGWEPDEERFIWVSGIWRRAPERKTWYPGYWADLDGSYAWVSGYWAEEGQVFLISQIPPDPIPEDPGTAPSPEHFWAPGHWDISQGVFQWKKGFWSRAYAGRVWIPFRYLWTPQGYLAVPGYWDYQLEDRGVLFAPVVIDPGTYSDEYYCPSVVVRIEYLPTHLFIDRDYGHYCFGDYYGSQARRGRFIPWVGSRTWCYDPLLIFFRIHHHDRYDHFRHRHEHFHDHADHRPRRTWQAQRQFQNTKTLHTHDALLSASIDTLRDGRQAGSRVKFHNSAEQWKKALEQNKQVREVQRKRPEILAEFSQTRGNQLREMQKKFADQQRQSSKITAERRIESQQDPVEQRREILKKLTQQKEQVRNLGKRDLRPSTSQKVNPDDPKTRIVPWPATNRGPNKSQADRPNLAERLVRPPTSQKPNFSAPKSSVTLPILPSQVPRTNDVHNQKRPDVSRSTRSVPSPKSSIRTPQKQPGFSLPGRSNPKPSFSKPKSPTIPKPSASKRKSPVKPVFKPPVVPKRSPPPRTSRRSTPSFKPPQSKPPSRSRPDFSNRSKPQSKPAPKPAPRSQPSKSFKPPSRSPAKPPSRSSSGSLRDRIKKGR